MYYCRVLTLLCPKFLRTAGFLNHRNRGNTQLPNIIQPLSRWNITMVCITVYRYYTYELVQAWAYRPKLCPPRMPHATFVQHMYKYSYSKCHISSRHTDTPWTVEEGDIYIIRSIYVASIFCSRPINRTGASGESVCPPDRRPSKRSIMVRRFRRGNLFFIQLFFFCNEPGVFVFHIPFIVFALLFFSPS